MDYPRFYNVTDFAAIRGVSVDHIRHACRNSIDPGKSISKAKLPDGWGAFMWGGIYIIYELKDAFEMVLLFDVELPNV